MAEIEVYKAIVAVTAAMGKDGIAKGRKNQQQGYSFRGIDDVYNALNGELARAQLVIIPRIVSRSVVERTTAKGGVLFYVTVEAEFDLVSAVDGSAHTARAFGEAMDSADKATNKAMSAAYKYMAMQVFCIPTEGDNDADAATPDVVVPQPQQKAVKHSTTVSMPGAEHVDVLDALLAELQQERAAARKRGATVPSMTQDQALAMDEAQLRAAIKTTKALRAEQAAA